MLQLGQNHTPRPARITPSPQAPPPLSLTTDSATGTLTALAFGPRTAIWHLCLARFLCRGHSGPLALSPPLPPHPTMQGTC